MWPILLRCCWARLVFLGYGDELLADAGSLRPRGRRTGLPSAAGLDRRLRRRRRGDGHDRRPGAHHGRVYDRAGRPDGNRRGTGRLYSVANAPGFKASTSQWTFSNLSASQLGGFDVYVYSATGENEGVFNATGASLNTSATPGTASPGPGWCFIGTASLNSGSFAFAIGETSGLLPGAV